RSSFILAKNGSGTDDSDSNIPEFDRRSLRVGLQAHVPERRPFAERPLLRVLVLGIVELDAENLFAVPDRDELALDEADLDLIPLAIRLGHAACGSDRAVERSGGVHVRRLAGVAADLQFHSGERRIALACGAQEDAAVALRSGAVFQTQNEVVVR